VLQIQAPANLVVQCQKIEIPELNTMGDLVQFTVQLINQYGDCSDRHQALGAAWPT
jgi:hypothetical protein